MREIKFKFWNKRLERYVNSDYLIGLAGFAIPDHIKPLEFTGYKDKNGKDIYEGYYDEGGNCVVWCDECAGWQFGVYDISIKEMLIKCHNCDGNFMFQDDLPDFIIQSNMYESSKKLN